MRARAYIPAAFASVNRFSGGVQLRLAMGYYYEVRDANNGLAACRETQQD